jgi:hypothetical protein
MVMSHEKSRFNLFNDLNLFCVDIDMFYLKKVTENKISTSKSDMYAKVPIWN